MISFNLNESLLDSDFVKKFEFFEMKILSVYNWLIFSLFSLAYFLSHDKCLTTVVCSFRYARCGFCYNLIANIIISHEFVSKFIIKYDYDSILNKNIEEFNLSKDDEKECKILIEMANSFNEMNAELNGLARLDFTSLDKIINFKQIKTDAIAEMMNVNNKQYYIPLFH